MTLKKLPLEQKFAKVGTGLTEVPLVNNSDLDLQ